MTKDDVFPCVVSAYAVGEIDDEFPTGFPVSLQGSGPDLYGSGPSLCGHRYYVFVGDKVEVFDTSEEALAFAEGKECRIVFGVECFESEE